MQPSLFVSHGAPNVVIVPSEVRSFLTGLANHLEKPDAIIIASAHYETDGVEVVNDPAPETMYDFGGFDPRLYEMVYAAKGSPKLAQEVADTLKDAGIVSSMRSRRGFDHGVCTPLMLAYPEADIPIVQVSVQPYENATHHFTLGKALAGFRKRNILVLGSGHITHNLRAVFSAMQGHPVLPAANQMTDEFVYWISDNLKSGEQTQLLDWEKKAPHAAFNHPTPEHFMPLFFAYGAGHVSTGGKPKAELMHRSKQFEIFTSDIWRFD